MKLSVMIKQLKRTTKGSLRCAVEDGLRIGKQVTVMGGVNFGSEPYLIKLGDSVRISSDVRFITHDGGTHAFRDRPEYKDVVKYGKIEVGEGSFIGAGVTILPGVTIGHHAVIGAGSLVNRDIPSETVWAGIPARQICTLSEYADRAKAAMPQDFDFEAYKADKRAYLTKLYWNE